MKKPWTAITLIAAISVFVLGTSSCSKKGSEPEPAVKLKDLFPKPTESDIQGVAIPQSGESKEAGVFTIRIDGLKLIKSYEGHLALTAREGMVWVEVEYTIRNNSDEVQTYFPDEDLVKLTDPAGKAHGITHVAFKWNEKTGAERGTIAARSEAKTSNFFEVPGDYRLSLKGWKFEVANKEYLAEPAAASFILK
jgi:hypothetical protein